MRGWVKIDDGMPEHPKLVNVGLAGLGLHLAGIAYCNRNLTDGFVPNGVAQKMALDNEGALDALVFADLWVWDYDRDGYHVHDYLDYQPSKADALALLRSRKQAGAKGGKRSSRARDKQTLSKTQANPQASAYLPLNEAKDKQVLTGNKVSSLDSSAPPSPPNGPPLFPPDPLSLPPLPPHTPSPPGAALVAPNGTQALIAHFIDRSRDLGSDPPRRLIGQVAKLVKELTDEGQSDQRIAAGIDLMLDRRLHPATLPSCVQEAALPRPMQRRPMGSADRLLADLRQRQNGEQP